jgi:hypothetical protein
VDSTWYSLDSAPWEEYVVDIAIDSDGVHTLEYYSVDGSDNVENEKTCEIKIDRSDPSIVISQEDGTEFDNSSVRIAWNCSDGCSGIDEAEYSLDGAAYAACDAESYVDLVDLDNGTHTLSVRVCDDAGNIAEGDIQFDVAAVAQDGDDDTNLLESLALWQVAGIAAVAAAIALVAVLALRRRRPSPPGGDDVPPPDDHGPAESPG